MPDATKSGVLITRELVDALAPWVVATLPSVAARIPTGPAAELAHTRDSGHPAGDVGALLAERLLGALELTIDDIRLDPPAALVTRLRPAGEGPGSIAVAHASDATSQVRAMALIAQLRPGLPSFVVALMGAQAADERIVPLLLVNPQLVGEEQIAGEFGRTHLALAVIAATAALRAAGVPIVAATPAAVMGIALQR